MQIEVFTISGLRNLMLVTLLFAFTACQRSTKPIVAVIPQTTAQEIWESEHAGAMRAAREHGWNVYWNGPSREDDLLRQIQIVNNAVSRGVLGLVLAPDHAVALISPVRNALVHGIPVVIVSSPIGMSPSQNVMFVVIDNRASGQIVADRAAMYLSRGDTVAVLGVNPNVLGSIDTSDALEGALRNRIAGVTILERRSTSFSFAEAEETAEEAIRSLPTLRVIVTLNVTQTRAAYVALSRTDALHRVKLIACNQDLDLVFHLRAGEIDAIVAQNTMRMGEEAIAMIQRYRQ